jgi:hypothetical protein
MCFFELIDSVLWKSGPVFDENDRWNYAQPPRWTNTYLEMFHRNVPSGLGNVKIVPQAHSDDTFPEHGLVC